MGKEAKIGLAVILVLVITFGVVIAKKFSGSGDEPLTKMEDTDDGSPETATASDSDVTTNYASMGVGTPPGYPPDVRNLPPAPGTSAPSYDDTDYGGMPTSASYSPRYGSEYGTTESATNETSDPASNSLPPTDSTVAATDSVQADDDRITWRPSLGSTSLPAATSGTPEGNASGTPAMSNTNTPAAMDSTAGRLGPSPYNALGDYQSNGDATGLQGTAGATLANSGPGPHGSLQVVGDSSPRDYAYGGDSGEIAAPSYDAGGMEARPSYSTPPPTPLSGTPAGRYSVGTSSSSAYPESADSATYANRSPALSEEYADTQETSPTGRFAPHQGYTTNQYATGQSAANQYETNQYPTDQHTIRPNDNYWVISKDRYGSGAYFKALAEHNRGRFPREDHLKIGEVISTPDVRELERIYPDLCPDPRRRETMRRRATTVSTRRIYAGGQTYVVQEGDTLFDIARYELGKSTRWVEIAELNRDVLGDDYDLLSVGMELTLPAKESMGTMTHRPSDDRVRY